MRTPYAGVALHKLETVEHEHTKQRSPLDLGQPLGRRAVDVHDLRLPDLDPDLEGRFTCSAVGARDSHVHRALAKPHQLALVGGSARSPNTT